MDDLAPGRGTTGATSVGDRVQERLDRLLHVDPSGADLLAARAGDQVS